MMVKAAQCTSKRMPISISERYKLIFEEHHYASDFRIKIFTGWRVMYAGLAAAFVWVHTASKSLSWTITGAAAVITALMWLADVRNRSALRASKDAGAAIESDRTAEIPDAQRFFTRLKTDSLFERLLTHSRAIDTFSIFMLVLFVAATWYLCSHKGVLPQ